MRGINWWLNEWMNEIKWNKEGYIWIEDNKAFWFKDCNLFICVYYYCNDLGYCLNIYLNL